MKADHMEAEPTRVPSDAVASVTGGPAADRVPRERAKAHIRDVARVAGVSHQTVSRVLNNQTSVRPATRDRVLHAIRELDYRPSVTARAMNTGRTNVLGVITFDDVRYGPVSVLHGIGEAAWERGYLVSAVAPRSLQPSGVAQVVDRLIDQAVDAVIVIAAQEWLARAVAEMLPDMPTVMLDQSFDERIPAISVDEIHGGRLAVDHLLSLGHSTVWHVAGPDGWIAASERLSGWRSALIDAGATVPEPLFGDWSADSGYELGRQLAQRREVTAVFAANDQMALGLVHALYDGGRGVPDDVSVVGFDDIPEATHLLPPLTTVRPDFVEVGRLCLTAALEQLGPRGAPVGRRVVAPDLVVRRSCGPPAPRDRG
jgi:DNA-binding LacI/PurR family transcriptional regulator